MKIDRVTITGADNKTNPESLLQLSSVYPWVEWGILFSKSQMGNARFPSLNWIQQLVTSVDAFSRKTGIRVNLSAHVCGKYLRDMLMGLDDFFSFHKDILSFFQRIQLNFHAEQLAYKKLDFIVTLQDELEYLPEKQFIVQIDGVNDKWLYILRKHNIPVAPLFDRSSGAGLCPDIWPERTAIRNSLGYEEPLYCGYAGGLGPDNLEKELDKIKNAVDRPVLGRFHPIWIDMETRVRSDDGKTLDLSKVERSLEKAQAFCI